MIKRPILLHTLLLIFGILLAYVLDNLFLSIISLIIFSLGTLLLYRRKISSNHGKKLKFLLLGGLIFFSLGMSGFLLLDTRYDRQFSEFRNQEIEAYGSISSVGEEKDNSQSFELSVEKVRVQRSEGNLELVRDGKVILYVSNSGIKKDIDYGQIIWVKGNLEKPRPQSNPGGFDYSLYLKGKGISGTLYSNIYNVQIVDGNKGHFVIKLGYFLRNYILRIVEKNFTAEQAGLLSGILIGYTDGLTKSTQQAFSMAGLTHIMAVSGANIIFIILPFAYIFKLMSIRRRYANVLLIGILTIFIAITGFQPSVLRAVLMADIVLIGQILKRESDFYSGISFAAMLLLLYNPFTLFDAGFLLSYGATISLVMFYTPIKAFVKPDYLPEVFKDILAGTLAAQIGVIPITLYYFNSLGIISIFTNILVVPLTGMLTILGFLLIFISKIIFLEMFLASFINLILTFILLVTKTAAGFQYSVLHVATPSLILISAYIIFVITVHIRPDIIKIYKFKIITGLLIYISISLISSLIGSELEIVFLDVGQGDATYIKTSSGKRILIDGGGLSGGGESDKGESVVMPFLYKYGGGALDIMISTHPDADHSAGLMTVIKKFPVKTIWVPYEAKEYERMDLLLAQKNIKKEIVKQGDKIYFGEDTNMEILNPLMDEAGSFSRNEENWINAQSIVLRLCYKNTAYLFCADVPEETESKLIEKKLNLKSDILRVGHHGAKSSSSERFIDEVSPFAAIISTGKNRYGHPSPETLERLNLRKIKIFRTDEDGAITILSNGEDIKISQFIHSN